MTLTKADLIHLKWGLIFVGGAILVAAGIALGTLYQQQTAQQRNRLASEQRTQSQNKLSRASQEEQELRDKAARLTALQNRGYIGKESRLDWIEQLARISREHDLREFQYEFLPQRPAEPLLIPSGAVAGTHRFLASTQVLSAKLLHEGDLLAFLADLRRSVKAYLIVRECRLDRIPPNPSDKGLAPQLNVECELEWITLQESS
jgi:hypothetical protein